MQNKNIEFLEELITEVEKIFAINSSEDLRLQGVYQGTGKKSPFQELTLLFDKFNNFYMKYYNFDKSYLTIKVSVGTIKNIKNELQNYIKAQSKREQINYFISAKSYLIDDIKDCISYEKNKIN